MNSFTRIVALPMIAAGILGGALTMAGPAAAKTTTTTTNGSHAIVATPDTKAPNNLTVNPWHNRHRHNGYWRH